MSKKKRLLNKKIKQEEQIKPHQQQPKDRSPVVHQRNKIEHYLTILHRELTEKQKKFIELALDKKLSCYLYQVQQVQLKHICLYWRRCY